MTDIRPADATPTQSPEVVYTIGHGTLSADELVTLLSDQGIDRLVDIRSFPGSRHNPQFGRDEMERWVPAAGIDDGFYGEVSNWRESEVLTDRERLAAEFAQRWPADEVVTHSTHPGWVDTPGVSGQLETFYKVMVVLEIICMQV